MLRSAIACSALIVAAGVMLSPAPAKADSFSFGYSSGDYRRGYYGPPRYHHHYHRPPPRYSYYRYDYYAPPPPVMYVPPPVVYAPPPVYAAPQVYAAPPMISAAPASPVYVAPNGQYCREYQGGVSVGGSHQRGYGTACLMPDGAWRVMN